MAEIQVDIKEGDTKEIELHDGSHLTIKKLGKDYDFTDPIKALSAIHEARAKQELITGLLYWKKDQPDHNTLLNVTDTPLRDLKEADLNPGEAVPMKLNASMK